MTGGERGPISAMGFNRTRLFICGARLYVLKPVVRLLVRELVNL